MLQIIGLVWPLIVIGSPAAAAAAVTTGHVDFRQTYSGEWAMWGRQSSTVNEVLAVIDVTNTELNVL